MTTLSSLGGYGTESLWPLPEPTVLVGRFAGQ